MSTPPSLVQAPSRLTTFRWCPMWLRIFSSVIRALCSLSVAPSGGQRPGGEKNKCNKCFLHAIWDFIFSERSETPRCTFEHLNSHSAAAGGVFYSERSRLHHLPEGSTAQRFPCERERKRSDWAASLITIIVYRGCQMLIKGDPINSRSKWPTLEGWLVPV